MDHSSNSGSVQSSSGDDDFNSRADSFSAFFHFSSSANPDATNLMPPASTSSHHYQVLDSLSYLDRSSLFAINPTTTAGTTASWTPLHSLHTQNCTTDFPSFTTSSPSNAALPSSRSFGATTSPMPVQPPEPPAAAAAAAAPARAPRSSKKRSRASRRPPTTVLTTDTSNFRAMVQEFTGIPSPPFAASGGHTPPFAAGRSRFDFFHPAATAAVYRSSTAADSEVLPTPYLLRSFAQKVQGFTSSNAINAVPSCNSCSSIASSNASILIPSTNGVNPTNNINSSDLGLGGQCQTLSNVLNIQFLLQPSVHAMTTMATTPFNTRPQTMPSTGYDSRSIPGLPPVLIRPSESMHSGWSTAEPSASENPYQAQFRSTAGNCTTGQQQRMSMNCRLNFSASDLLEITPEKGPETVVVSTEGTVESWICSSD